MNFDNKVILITGASTGIGNALVKLLAKNNCSLALIARRGYLLKELEYELKDINTNILAINCDVSKQNEVRSAVKSIKNRFNRIDVAILNAAIGCKTSVEKFETAKARNVFDVNVFGIANFVEEIVPEFIERKEGVFVGVSTLAESRGWKGSGFYCASKAAVTILLENLRLELKPFNVKVLTVKPGFVDTPMITKNKFYMPFLMSAEKAAKIIYKGIQREKKIIQFPFPTALGYKFSRIVPDFIIEYFSERESSKKT